MLGSGLGLGLGLALGLGSGSGLGLGLGLGLERAREGGEGVEQVVHPLRVAVAHLPARAELVHRLDGGAERAYDRQEDGEYAQEEVEAILEGAEQADEHLVRVRVRVRVGVGVGVRVRVRVRVSRLDGARLRPYRAQRQRQRAYRILDLG